MKANNSNLEEKLAHIPRRPGVYLFKDRSGAILYIGKAKVLRNRVRSYFQDGRTEGIKLTRLVSKIHDLEVIVTDSEMEALILEMNLVKEHKPRYNISLKDDKSFPYIRVTNERFPRIFPTRKLVRDGSRYFGPYTDVGMMRGLLKAIKRIFPIRSCNYDLTQDTVARKKIKLCLDYHIQKCDGPCQGLVSAEDYGAMIEQVVKFINGRDKAVVGELTERMHELAGQKRFEEAARMRDRIRFIENFHYKQKITTGDLGDRDVLAVAMEDEDACGLVFKIRDGKIIGRQHFYMTGVIDESYPAVVASFLKQYYLKAEYIPTELYLPVEIPEMDDIGVWLGEKAGATVHLTVPQKGEKARLVAMCNKNARLLLEELQLQKQKSRQKIPHAVVALQRDLRLKKAPRRIEAFDISNIQGSDPVASMVCFVDGVARKADYRKFKIRGKASPDDFAMMHEAVTRRYSGSLKQSMPDPDLILIDGGKGQLNSALSALQSCGMDSVPVISLAKRLDEVFVPGDPVPLNIPRTSSGLKLLQRLRDESHRFAVTFHRSLRRKRTAASELDVIPGVGPAKRKALLTFFGSVEGVRDASVDDLQLVSGISAELAKTIWEHFHVQALATTGKTTVRGTGGRKKA